MSLTANTIKPAKNSSKTKKRLGRGNASGKGTYSARGLKGQRSRSGGKGGLKLRGLKAAIKKVPKLRGFKSLVPKKETISLDILEHIAKEGDIVTPFYLKKKKIIKNIKNSLKIVATGELKKKITIKGCVATKKAVELIEKSGSKITF